MLLPLQSLRPSWQALCWRGEGLGHRAPATAELELPSEESSAIKPGCPAGACLFLSTCSLLQLLALPRVLVAADVDVWVCVGTCCGGDWGNMGSQGAMLAPHLG